MAVGGMQGIASSIYFEAQQFTFSSQNTKFDKMSSFGFQQVYYPTNYSQMQQKSFALMNKNKIAGTFDAFSYFCKAYIVPIKELNTSSSFDSYYDIYYDATTSNKYFVDSLSNNQNFDKNRCQHDIRNYRSYAASAFYGNFDFK